MTLCSCTWRFRCVWSPWCEGVAVVYGGGGGDRVLLVVLVLLVAVLCWWWWWCFSGDGFAVALLA